MSPFTAPLLLLLPLLQDDSSEGVELNALERAFTEHMKGVQLVGSFTLDSQPDAPPQRDVYTIKGVEKLANGRWRFDALIEYGERTVPFSLPVPVEWAGDTPVISVTKMWIPGAGTYSARVVIDAERYAGTWSGKDYGGHMYGYVRPMDGEEGGKPKTGQRRQNWPQFRGEGARGVAEGHPTVAEWDIESGDNIRWRVELPGLAHSSPVIFDDRIFVTSAIRLEGEAELRVGLYGSITPVPDEGEHGFVVMGIDKRTGDILWEEAAWEGVPKYPRHPKGSFAASTPATDGKHVVAFFGNEGLYCYDVKGKLLWGKDMGDLDSGYFQVKEASWGFASSPVIYEDKVIVQVDVQGPSYVAALDVATGEELWKTVREEVPTWCTPTVHVSKGRRQVICNGWKDVGGYDLDTGAELWKLVGSTGDVPVPTPIVADDKIFLTNAHGGPAPIYAIATGASGTLSTDPEESDGLVWVQPRKGIYQQTPIVVGEFAYFCNDAGIVRCFDVASGAEVYSERLGAGRSGFTGSAVAADGKLYFSSEEGQIYVVKEGWEFEILAENSLGEEMMSTPAISAGVLYFRSRDHLTAVGSPDA